MKYICLNYLKAYQVNKGHIKLLNTDKLTIELLGVEYAREYKFEET